MFKLEPKRLNYLKHNFFVKPQGRVMTSYSEQESILKDLTRLDKILPPNLKYLVIDNISNKLRFELSENSDLGTRSLIANEFFHCQLVPLINFSVRARVKLILIHEVSYSPNLNKTLLFFHKLYDRIESLNIFLSQSFATKKRQLQIFVKDQKKILDYSLSSEGFNWY